MPLVRAALVLILCLCSALEALAQNEAQAEMARLRPQVAWQRTSPNAKALDGPVLYQIIMRSNATQGHIPKISNTFTLTNSLISEDTNGIHIGTMSVDSTGIITFANGQSFPGGGVTSITAGTGLTGGTINTTGTIALDTSFTDARYASSSSLASYLLLSGGTMTGALQLNGDPTQPLHAATKAYVDAGLLANKNSLGVLAADYEFDETSGSSFADSSGFNNTANAPISGIAVGASGHTGKAINFSGGVVMATGTPDSPQVWVEAWVSYFAGLPNGIILTKPGTYSLQLQSAAVVFTAFAANGSCSAQSAPLPANAFFHAGGWYNGLTVVVEANGKTTEVPCTMGPLVHPGSLFIGAADINGTNPFSGTIDEVRIRSVAPPPAQVTPTLTNQFCGATPPTIGSFSFSSLTGYRAAAAACQARCSSLTATMCTSGDMVRSAQLGSLGSGPALWYSAGILFAAGANDCNGWTNGTSSVAGPAWGLGTPGNAACSTSLSIACCMPQ